MIRSGTVSARISGADSPTYKTKLSYLPGPWSQWIFQLPILVVISYETKVRQIDLRLEPPAVCLRSDDAQRILIEQIEADLECVILSE